MSTTLAILIVLAIILFVAFCIQTRVKANRANKPAENSQLERDPFDVDRENVRNLMGDNTR